MASERPSAVVPGKLKMFLDIDGTFSPLQDHPEGTWPDFEAQSNLPLSRQMADALARLPLDITWLTTWSEAEIAPIYPRVGWQPLPAVRRNDYSERPWWKLNAVLHHLRAGGGSFVWADDWLSAGVYGVHPHGDPDPAVNPLGRFGVPYLLVPTDKQIGLTPDDIERVARFAQSLGLPVAL